MKKFKVLSEDYCTKIDYQQTSKNAIRKSTNIYELSSLFGTILIMLKISNTHLMPLRNSNI